MTPGGRRLTASSTRDIKRLHEPPVRQRRARTRATLQLGTEPKEKRVITKVTRARLFDDLRSVAWWGDLEEIAFLSRLYDLHELPSTDSRREDAEGDILQHRVANDDWSDDWIFSDERFGLTTSDEHLLRFLCETIHPEVRADAAEVRRLAELINDHVRRDGWEIFIARTISEYPVFGWRKYEPATVDEHGGFADGQFVADRYEIVEFVAAGGMASVYRALDTQRGCRVALKLCPADAIDEDRLRFAREVRAMRRIAHPNVMPILDAHLTGATPFFVMPEASRRLDEQAERLRATPEEALLAFEAVCEGVIAIHDAGELHRDIKPKNILLLDGRWVVSDLGLAVFLERDSTILTRSSTVVGTEGYIPPELRARTRVPPTPSLDVFSLGIVLYELMTGADPAFVDEQRMKPALAAIVRRASARNPEVRYQTVRDLLEDVRSYRKSLSPDFSPDRRARVLGVREEQWTAELCRQYRQLFVTLDSEVAISVFDELSDENLATFAARYPGELEVILTHYREAMEDTFRGSHRHAFPYAETVARRMAAVIRTTKADATVVCALRCMIVASVDLWRFKALDRLFALIEGVADARLAQVVASALMQERARMRSAQSHKDPAHLHEAIAEVWALIGQSEKR